MTKPDTAALIASPASVSLHSSVFPAFPHVYKRKHVRRQHVFYLFEYLYNSEHYTLQFAI